MIKKLYIILVTFTIKLDPRVQILGHFNLIGFQKFCVVSTSLLITNDIQKLV